MKLRGTCEVDGCERAVNCRGLCSLHYQRSRLGIPLDHPVLPARWADEPRLNPFRTDPLALLAAEMQALMNEGDSISFAAPRPTAGGLSRATGGDVPPPEHVPPV